MAKQVMRVSDTTHREVSMYAAKRERTMAEVGDEIVAAGLAALSGGGAAKPAGLDDEERGRLRMEIEVLRGQLADAKRAKPEAAEHTEATGDDRATLLSQALRGLRVEGPDGDVGVLGLVDAEAMRWNASPRGKNAQRGRVETVLAAISTAVRRRAATNRYGAELTRQKQAWDGGAKRGKVKVTT